jgi:ATP-dependent Clp protease protease subunit
MAKTHNPIRCFDGNAQPHEPFWRFVDQAESESGQAELELYGVLSEYSWFEDDITPKKFKNDLYKYGQGGPVLLKINSPGGDVIAASVMRAILTDYPGEVTARVDGMAASAAVAVTMAAKTIQMMDAAYMMIHDPSVVVFLVMLDIETLGQLRDSLKAIKDGLVPIYASRTGLSNDRISRMMTDETWMSAKEAVAFGFADQVLDGGQKNNAGNVAFVNCLQNYEHVPPALLQAITQPVPPEVESSASLPPAEADEREAQTLRDRVNQILKKETPHA